MPPHTEEIMIYETPNESPTHEDTAVSACVVTRRRNILPPKDSIPFLKCRQVSAMSVDGALDRVLENGDRVTGLVSALGTLHTRVETLLNLLDESGSHSPLRDACRQSLVNRMPLVLKQCTVLVDNIVSSTDSRDEMVASLRASFAMVAAVQFLDTVEEALTGDSSDVLNERLEQVMAVAKREAETRKENLPADPLFRVSHWVAPSLAFDAVCGTKVHTSLQGRCPLNLEVEPIITFKADVLLSNNKNRNFAYRCCRVQVLECRHRPVEFAEGAGGLGVAFVRIHVSPIEDSTPDLRIWGEQEVEKLLVKEVRAVQLNAFPPKPRAFVDLYTSSVYGDSGVTVTVVIKTSVTENSESPNLHMELFVAPLLAGTP